ncbi:MAG: hypothetical protein E6I63_01870 [Chloroflexi bacterium]|nr:MAG: hypothetical protein E6I63_01870 [Chloroflexota bacterium]
MSLTEAAAFEGVAGHSRALRLLESQLQRDHLAQAYLFTGEANLGKTEVARRLAKALLPEHPLERHPDYWEDDRGRAIPIDEIRLLPDRQPEFHAQSLQHFLSLKPAIATRRVALITSVGRLKDEVQGILLKTLEEPHPGRVIILTSPGISPFVVLPTVVSRCQRLSFHAVAEDEIQALLEARGVAAATAAGLARLSRGRPGWALRAAQDADVLTRHAAWLERLQDVMGGPADAALRLAAELDSAHLAWRNSERWGGPTPEEGMADPLLEALGSWQLELRRRLQHDSRPGPWARLLELSYDTIGYHEQNVSPRLNLECFLLECRRAS